ncbi:MAG: low specificity L-threonine aldolase [Sphaerochaetaceae bacterium]|nr:low specificity L-threonine aldolase [Sphaerochaetaceae bacterium]
MNKILYFSSDYQEGAHPNIIQTLVKTNLESTPGYGLDPYTDSACDRIRKACNCPEAQVELMVGGTQTNATCIDAILRNYEGVVSAKTGHVALHEAGAIEASGHKVLEIEAERGKMNASGLKKYLETYYADENHEHMVKPGMVYISQPTEYGTLYSKKEIEELSDVAHSYSLPLYVDGARLAYALASKENDVTLEDLAKLTDIFYIGGTKCGALFGEAIVIPDKNLVSHFLTTKKQHGGLLAKGRLLGIQFDELFKDKLYLEIGKDAVEYAKLIQDSVESSEKLSLLYRTPTNQCFIIVPNKKIDELRKHVSYGFWEKYDDDNTVIRVATSWATTEESVKELIKVLEEI